MCKQWKHKFNLRFNNFNENIILCLPKQLIVGSCNKMQLLVTYTKCSIFYEKWLELLFYDVFDQL